VSLIQEALKRQQEDSGGGKAVKAGGDAAAASSADQGKGLKLKAPKLETDALSAVTPEDVIAEPPPLDGVEPPPLPDDFEGEVGGPPPVPPDGKAASGPKKNKTVLIIVGVVSVIVLTLGAIIWLAASAFKNMARPGVPPPAPDSAENTSARGPDAPTADSTSSSPAPAVPKPRPAANVTVVPDKPEVNLVTGTPAGPGPTTPAGSPPEVKAAKEPVLWPVLSVKGVLMKPPRGIAIINGELVAAGESIDEVEVVTVGPDYVVLEYKGERRTMRPGEITD
jgi:hypothetical protein